MLKANTNSFIHNAICISSITLAAFVIVSSIAIISYKAPQGAFHETSPLVPAPELNEDSTFLHDIPKTVPVHFIEFPPMRITLNNDNDMLDLNKQLH